MTLFLAGRHSIKREDVARDSPLVVPIRGSEGRQLEKAEFLAALLPLKQPWTTALSQMRHWTTKPQWFVTLPLTCVKRFLGRDRN